MALASQRLFASIRGGNYRKVFRGKSISVSAGPSRDLSLTRASSQHLGYKWSCTSNQKQNTRVCQENMGTCKFYISFQSISHNTAYSTGNRVIIPAYSQPNNQTLRVMLLIRSTFDPLRTATTKQSIVFSSSRQLINVNIACVSNCNGNKYTIQMPIHLKGQCLRCQNKKISKWIWRVEGLPVEGASKRLIFDVKETKKRLLGIHLNVEAVNRYNSKLTYYGTSWVFLEKNMGPADTMCTISPRVGNAHETQFLLHCNQSQARFKPLQYCIGVENFLVDECKSDEDIQVRLPPTEHVVVMVSNNVPFFRFSRKC